MKKQNYLFLPITILGATTFVAGTILAAGPTFAATQCTTNAETGQTTCTGDGVKAAVTVASNACSMAISNDGTNWGESATDTLSNMAPGQLSANLGKSQVRAQCSDLNTHYFKVVGSSTAVGSNTSKTSMNGANGAIPAGTATEGDTSSWSMMVASGADTNAPTIMNGYGNYKAIPASEESVASFQPTVDTVSTPSYINLRYRIYVASAQPVGTYTGQVTVSLAHTN